MLTKITQNGTIRFKAYAQDIMINLPVCIEDLVSENALAQIINELVEGIELEELERYYSGLGCPPYHPKMMIKVWIYGYCTKVYTSRPLSRKLREDLVFIWLAGGQRPCFKTLSDFRSCRMQDLVDTVLSTVLLYLVEHGYVNLEDLYVDGSKWAANANKHKIVWRKNTERYKAGVVERIGGLLEALKELQQAEDAAYGNKDLIEHQSKEQIQVVLTSADLEKQLIHLNELIESQRDKKRKRSMEKIQRHLCKEQAKLEKYEGQQRVLDHRNSYSKTDEDATAMRMKDDRLLPAYNVQITTSEQFIVNATMHQNGSDNPTLSPHVEKLEGYKEEVKKRLASKKGLAKRSQRSVDVETPFANIKYNMAHRRFVLRGIDKVNVEFQLLALAHNIKKVYCEQTGIWVKHYARRAATPADNCKKRA